MDYLDSSEIESLLNRLIARSEEGSLVWEANRSEYSFRTRGKKYSYVITSVDKDDYPPHRFEIWRGEVNDPTDPDSALIQAESTRETFDLNVELEDLYELAKRATLNIDGIASEILEDLD